jgi:hypothetical protein
MVTLEDMKKDPVIDAFIRKGNKYLGVMGFTEHSYRHVSLVSSIAKNVMDTQKDRQNWLPLRGTYMTSEMWSAVTTTAYPERSWPTRS